MLIRLSRRDALALGLGSALGLGTSLSLMAAAALPPVRKGYLPGRHGQLHYRIARTAENPSRIPCLCLHKAPFASLVFAPVLPRLGADRTVLAPDLPGYGDSDAPPNAPRLEDYVDDLLDVLDRMALETVDLIGHESGAAIAVALAHSQPNRVRRLILIDPPIEDGWTPGEPQQVIPAGLHLQAAWDRHVTGAMEGWSQQRAQLYLADAVRRPAISHWADEAVAAYPLAERLASLAQPTLRIDLAEAGWGWGFLDRHPDEVAALCRGFLDRPVQR